MQDPVLYQLGEPCTLGKQPFQQGKLAKTGEDKSDSDESEQNHKGKTSVMLRNLPDDCTREMFLQLLDDQGFKCKYDFAHLPFDFFYDANLGYAFVNMVDSEAVDLLWKAFQGFSDWRLPSYKVCEVTWSAPHQGLKAHVARYRNSPLMHDKVPDDFKPVILRNGARQPFPKPTKSLRAPFPF